MRKRRTQNRRRRRNRNRDHTNRKLTRQNVLTVLRWALEIVLVIGLAFGSVWFFGQQVSTVGDSMKPELSNGDVVLVNRLSYNIFRPKRGDVIVFKPQGNENNHYYIKRIIGLPGETVQILENAIYIDGEKLEEKYETTDVTYVGLAGDPITLGDDEYFVLGDDRQNSEDSRDLDVGNVKRSYIFGKAWFVLSPLSDFGFVN